MMAIEWKCPSCGYEGQAPDNLAGRSGKCPKCQQPVTLPTSIPGTGEPDRPTSPEPLEPLRADVAQIREHVGCIFYMLVVWFFLGLVTLVIVVLSAIGP